MAKRIILADDSPAVLDLWGGFLSGTRGFEVMDFANDGRQAVRLSLKRRPDVVVMDLSMPELNGFDAAAMIVDECPAIRVVVVSGHADKQFVVRAFRSGATGYLAKEDAAMELAEAVRVVSSGKVFISRTVRRFLGTGQETFQDRMQATHDQRRAKTGRGTR
ncbi:MAG: response regulator transcription factor [Verrucomicrobiae bacterium]|nr:response regulator transcription factor [Verrucomicrobiae bacterium]